jgi:hypothetical protein
MFFVMMVLFVIAFQSFESEKNRYLAIIEELNMKDSIIRVQAEKYRIIEAVESNLESLKEHRELFVYEEKYKRYRLAFDIQFKIGRVGINPNDVTNYYSTKRKIDLVGIELRKVVLELMERRRQDPEKFKEVSYLIVVTGSASNLPNDNVQKNYYYSYSRALSLYQYWKAELGIDFDAPHYHDFIEFQIAGSGIGGVGRFNYDPPFFLEERKNQRFLINIIPKIGEI